MRAQGSVSVAANGGVSGNVLAGKLVEFISGMRAAQVKVWAAAAAAGITASFSSGTDIVLESGSSVSSANRTPIDPDDVLCRDIATQGERLILNFTNPTAGAIVVNWIVEVIPVA